MTWRLLRGQKVLSAILGIHQRKGLTESLKSRCLSEQIALARWTGLSGRPSLASYVHPAQQKGACLEGVLGSCLHSKASRCQPRSSFPAFPMPARAGRVWLKRGNGICPNLAPGAQGGSRGAIPSPSLSGHANPAVSGFL